MRHLPCVYAGSSMDVQCFEIKTEADSNDVTEWPCDDTPSTGMFAVSLWAYYVCHLLWCFCPHTLLISINDKSYLWNICLSVHLSISQRLRPCRWRCWTCLLRSTRLITASCFYCVISVHHMASSVCCSPGLTVLASNVSGMLVFWYLCCIPPILCHWQPKIVCILTFMQMIPWYMAGDLSSPQSIGLLQLQRLQSVIFSVCSPSSVQLYVWSPAHRNEIELHFYCAGWNLLQCHILGRISWKAVVQVMQLRHCMYCMKGTWNTAITFEGTLDRTHWLPLQILVTWPRFKSVPSQKSSALFTMSDSSPLHRVLNWQVIFTRIFAV